MVIVVGVRFKKAGKIYYFDPDHIDIQKHQNVIVETSRGVEFGEVVVGPKEIPEEDIVAPLKKVLRVATIEDEIQNQQNIEKEKEAFEICLEKIIQHQLDMKLIDVEYTFDNNKVIFYFTADGRVDFRELVKDLAAIFKTRIELRQIGVRDEAKMIGGMGPCGKSLCCATWLGDFEPVSIKMAKEQNLSLNPTKISGICGRLMCCLKYEHEMYQNLRDNLPEVGEKVLTPDGPGIVMENNVLLECVKIRLIIEEKSQGKDDKLSDDVQIYDKYVLKRANCCCGKNNKDISHNNIEGEDLTGLEE
ncbi:stage 0 sporulation family protein [Clostridiaceae bacterium 35-E11]